MIPDPQDTIVALSSARGPGGRAIVRLSGEAALKCASSLFTSREVIAPGRRWRYAGQLHLPGIHASLPADLYLWPAPRTYTGQELVELHTVSCMPLIDQLIGQLLNGGARAAQAGEFTLRAFLAGKLDLTQAEAVLGVIEASTDGELKQALAQLAGGMTNPLRELREDLLNLLADVEAALDFSDEDLQFVDQSETLTRIAKGLAHLVSLRRRLEERAVADRPFRVVLAGEPNAGKSSLFNALGEGITALVSPEPGTTRDYLVKRFETGDVVLELVDTAGLQESTDSIDDQAQWLGRSQTEQADLVLLCVEASRATNPPPFRPPFVAVLTKADLCEPQDHPWTTSAVSGLGLAELKAFLIEQARLHRSPPLAPSLSRCRHHVESCLAHLRRAHALVLHEDPPEILALELRGALDQLGEMVGAVCTDELLDRVFSRFCIGK